jgi:large subunit ribosomal protein L19
MNLIHDIEKENMKTEFAPFDVGDTVEVETVIREEAKDKEKAGKISRKVKGKVKEAKVRRQFFTGVVLSMKGRGIRKTFTIRRIVQGEGVERVFPFHSPLVTGFTVKKRGVVRRAKLYYLQQRSGKGARIRERIDYNRSDSKKKS